MISFLQESGTAPPLDCSQCVAGGNCATACNGAGTCAYPGSVNPNECCECATDGGNTGGGGISPEKPSPTEDCSACAPNGDCDASCQAMGFDSGTCAVPGSTDEDNCCACHEDTVAPQPSKPPLTDNHAPEGVLDGASNGVVRGWACDKDAPDKPVTVHIFVGGPSSANVPVKAIVADQPSDPAVITACGGGKAHRFRYTIPNYQSVVGEPVYVYGMNLTEGGKNPNLSNSPQIVK